MGSRDDNARIGVVFPYQIGNAGGRDDAQQINIGAHAAQSGSKGAFQHIAGHAGVLADQDAGAVAIQAGQHRSGGTANLKCQFTGQIAPGHAAHAVRSKQFTHINQILSFRQAFCPPFCPMRGVI